MFVLDDVFKFFKNSMFTTNTFNRLVSLRIVFRIQQHSVQARVPLEPTEYPAFLFNDRLNVSLVTRLLKSRMISKFTEIRTPDDMSERRCGVRKNVISLTRRGNAVFVFDFYRNTRLASGPSERNTSVCGT